MNKVVSINQAVKIAKQLRKQGKHIVLVGGCFDIVHIGHVTLLEKAKEKADVLMVLLESDETVRKLKGENRPINTQEDRANVLASLSAIGYVILLPPFKSNKEYDNLIAKIRPSLIATTEGDLGRRHKERQARVVGARVLDVVRRIPYASTTKLARLLYEGDWV